MQVCPSALRAHTSRSPVRFLSDTGPDPIRLSRNLYERVQEIINTPPLGHPVILLPPRQACSVRRVRNRGLGEGPPLVPHSTEYDDLFTPHTSSRQRYVSDHSHLLVALFDT